MKKQILLTLGGMLLCAALHAGSLTFINSTGSPVFIAQLQGRNSAGTPAGEFSVGDVVVQPGMTVYSDPTTVTGIPSYALPAGFFTGLMTNCSPAIVAVGSPTFSTMPASQVVPAGNDCTGSSAFTITWSQGAAPNYNVVVLMLP